MKRYLYFCLSGLVAAGALAIAGPATYLPLLADAGTVQTAQVPQANINMSADVRSRLASAVDDAVTVNGFPAMAGSFDRVTRFRIGLDPDIDLDPLNARIVRFRRDFKDKYNEEFHLEAADLADIPVYRNADDDDAIVRPSSFPSLNMDNQTPTANSPIFLRREQTQGDNGWRIVIPENVSGRQLRDAVGNALAAMDDNQAAWPSNVHDGYAMVAGQILQRLTQLQGDGANLAADIR